VLPLPANWIAVPPVPMMAPASKMLTGRALLMAMPAEPEITPKLVIPPVKILPAMATAVLVARISLALSMRMPWLTALMLPLSTIAPATVLSKRAMPVAATIVPAFAISPVKDDTAQLVLVEKPSWMPRLAAEIEPLLLMPPVKVEIANSSMPADPAAIVPVLTMPPPALTSENTATLPTRMPLPDFDAILPLLLMPPAREP
jgi:hypothetical protein